jgi:hypothetical protein
MLLEMTLPRDMVPHPLSEARNPGDIMVGLGGTAGNLQLKFSGVRRQYFARCVYSRSYLDLAVAFSVDGIPTTFLFHKSDHRQTWHQVSEADTWIFVGHNSAQS